MLKSTIIQANAMPKDQVEVRKIKSRQGKARWIALILGCLVLFGQQYCFDNPSALQHTIQENLKHQGKGVTDVTFNMLYILYSLPNVVICIFGGALIDRFKARTIMVITIIILTIGQAVFTVGGYQNIFWIMLTGRIIFGVAAETLTASQNTLISNWFKPNELSLILGISISLPKLGSSLNNYVSPLLAKKFENGDHHENVWVPLAVGLGLAIISIVIAVILFMMDFRTDKKQEIVYKQSVKASKNINQTPQKQSNKKYISTSSIKVQQVENLLDENEGKVNHGQEHISFQDIKKLPATFWLLLLVCTFSEALFIPFLDNGNSYFSIVYSVTPQKAGTYLILPYCICALIVPIFGYFIDKIAKRAVVIVFSCVAFLITYGIMMAFERIDKQLQEGFIAIPLILLGVCCAVYCTAIVPTVPMLVQRKLLGTAFGLMQMLQNLALGTFPLISAAIRDQFPENKRTGFQWQTLFYFVISVICLICAIALLIRDKMTDNKLYVKDFQNQYVKTVLENEFNKDNEQQD